jgi:type VI secretion system ImpM family protein
VLELDHWISEGIVLGYNELDSAWDRTFDAAPPGRFMYVSPRTQRVLTGLFRPSVDKAGRRYPFLVYAVVEPAALGLDLAMLPLAIDAFAGKAAEVMQSAGSAANVNAFLSSVDALRFELDIGEAKRRFGRHVLSTGSADFFGQAFGAANDPRAYAALESVAEGPLARAPNSFSVRLPVAGEADVSFWLELTRRFNRNGAMASLTLWTEPGATPSRAHFCYGELASRSFLPVVMPGQTAYHVRDLCSASGDAQATQRGKQTFDAVLSSGSPKLSELLQRLPRCKGL